MRTTLDPKMQLMARKALVDGLVRYDEAHGWHGTVKSIDLGQDWGVPLGDIPEYGDIKPWRLAVVLDVSTRRSASACSPNTTSRGALGRRSRDRNGDAGRLQMDRPAAEDAGQDRRRRLCRAGRRPAPANTACARFRRSPAPASRWIRSPAASWRWSAASPTTMSEFNRATQAQRQPGSSFKPFVYAAALDNGYTPSSIVLDEPIEIDQGNGEIWTPRELRGQVRGAAYAALRRRALDQPDDGAAGARHRHAADRRIRQALRRLRQSAATTSRCRWAPARRPCCA